MRETASPGPSSRREQLGRALERHEQALVNGRRSQAARPTNRPGERSRLMLPRIDLSLR